MKDVWRGIRVGFIEWLEQLSPQDYINFISTIVKVVFILLIARIVLRIGNTIIKDFFKRQQKARFGMEDRKANTLRALSQNILRYVVYFIAVLVILPEFGIRTESIIATAGIGGLAVGFGAQSLVKDVISGFFILFEDQYAVGDYISIGDVTGTVEEIGIRITKIRGFKGDLSITPNGQITKVINYTRGNALAIVDVDIAYESDIEEAIAIMGKIANRYADGNMDIVEPPQVLGVMNLAPSGIDIRLIARTLPLKHWGVERELRKLIKEAFDDSDIKIADMRKITVDKRNRREER